MSIQDKDVRTALEVLNDEFESAENVINEQQDEIDSLEALVETLETDKELLEKKVKELEEALIEAHLTGDTND